MKIGDTVTHIDEDITGVIVKISETRVVIETDFGFEMEFSKKEVVVVPKDTLSISVSAQVLAEKNLSKNPKTPKKASKKGVLPPMEVDLHIHQLVNNEKGLTAHDKLNIQLDTAKRQIEFAIQKRIQRVVFIHGIGQGVLRSELEYLLRRYDTLKYYDADYSKYGRGALEVYIFQNSKSV